MNLITWAGVCLTVVIFTYVEVHQLKLDSSRSKTPVYVMGLMLLTLAAGLIRRLL